MGIVAKGVIGLSLVAYLSLVALILLYVYGLNNTGAIFKNIIDPIDKNGIMLINFVFVGFITIVCGFNLFM